MFAISQIVVLCIVTEGGRLLNAVTSGRYCFVYFASSLSSIVVPANLKNCLLKDLDNAGC